MAGDLVAVMTEILDAQHPLPSKINKTTYTENLTTSELGQHPGAEDHPEAGLAAVDLNVRVPAKTLLHLPGQHLGLRDHRDSTATNADALTAYAGMTPGRAPAARRSTQS